MAIWSGTLGDVVQQADLQDVGQDLQYAMVQLDSYQKLAPVAQAMSDPAVASALANATSVDQSLATIGDALVADANTYIQGKSQINPWNVNTPPQLALARLPKEHADLVSGTQAAAGANQALATAVATAQAGGAS